MGVLERDMIEAGGVHEERQVIEIWILRICTVFNFVAAIIATHQYAIIIWDYPDSLGAIIPCLDDRQLSDDNNLLNARFIKQFV